MRLKSRKFGLLLAGVGLIGFAVTKTATNTLCFDLNLKKFDESGEITGVWVQPEGSSSLKLVQVLWISAIVLGVSNTIGLAALPRLELRISNGRKEEEDEEEDEESVTPEHDFAAYTRNIAPVPVPVLAPDPALAPVTVPDPVRLASSKAAVVKDLAKNTVVARSQEKRNRVVFNDLLHEPIVIIYGPQMGCGKTSTSAGFIANHIKNGANVTACLPIVARENFLGIPIATTTGTDNSYEQIGTAISNFVEIAKERNARYTDDADYNPHSEPTEVIYLDELMDYESKVGVELLSEFWDIAIRYGRQFNLRAILSTHGVTKTFLGGEKALASIYKTVVESAAILELERTKDPEVRGGYRPSGNYKLKPSGASISDVKSGRVQALRGVIPESFSAPYTIKDYGDGTSERHYDFTQLVTERDLARVNALGFVTPGS